MKPPLPSSFDLPPPERPESVQPGGFGLFVRMELLWGGVRRALLRRLAPGHVARWQARRQGECDRFGADVVDSRDLKFVRNVCGVTFDGDDPYRRRASRGFARYGYAEL